MDGFLIFVLHSKPNPTNYPSPLYGNRKRKPTLSNEDLTMTKFHWTALMCATMLAANIGGLQAGEGKTGFLNKIHKGKDGDVKYIVFVPKDYGINDDQKVYPVILFLHGSGESGTDGKKQAGTGLGKAIRDKNGNFPFITIFPQSQKGGWKAESAEGIAALAILDEVQKNYKTDPKRVYLTGLSMGGSGTWSLAAAHPDRWAAIAPICGRGNLNDADKIKNLPCWCFCGDKDNPKLVENNRALIKALKDAGGSPRYSEYPFVGHNSWDCAYVTPELYTWFLKHATK
jgi:predicted peptidase